jgi:hypothetical protein
MIVLQSYPEVGQKKRYLAINNPLIYKFTTSGKGGGGFFAYEYPALLVGSSGGGQIELSEDRTGTVKPGDVILINNTSIRNVVNTQYLPISNRTLIFIDQIIAGSAGGVIKSLNNYRGEFRVFHGRKQQTTGGALINAQVGVNFEFTPDINGIINFNVQPFLKSFVDFRTLISTTKKNTADGGVWGRFYIQYRERWDGDGKDNETGWAPDPVVDANFRWWVSAVRQIRTESGVSMFPQINSDPFEIFDPEPLGQFLTAFNEPEYYVGYQNEIAFGWPEYGGYNFLTLKEERLNAAKQVQASTLFDMLNEGRQEINRIKIGNYTDTYYVRLSIDPTADPSESYVQANYVQELYVETI